MEPDTKYYYSIEADLATLVGADEQHWFRTASTPGKARKLRFWLLGDSGANRPRTDPLEKVLAAKGPMDTILVRNGFRKFNKDAPLDGIILLGDNAYPQGTDEQYTAALFNVYADEFRHTPLYPCIGNHDMDNAYLYSFTTNSDGRAGGVPSKNMLYYSVDIANLHLIVMDPWKCWLDVTDDEKHLPWQKQLEWFKKDLAANKLPWQILVHHFPVYCDGNYSSDTNGPLIKLRERLVPILDENDVDLCLTGHDHTYQRTYLLAGHTGDRKTFDPAKHLKFDGDGRDKPMLKKPGANNGCVYMVSGTAGGSRPAGKFSHPAMVEFELGAEKDKVKPRGLGIPSSLVIEIDGDKLTAWQVGIDGKPIDQFSMVKGKK